MAFARSHAFHRPYSHNFQNSVSDASTARSPFGVRPFDSEPLMLSPSTAAGLGNGAFEQDRAASQGAGRVNHNFAHIPVLYQGDSPTASLQPQLEIGSDPVLQRQGSSDEALIQAKAIPGTGWVQRKLTIGQPNDRYEQEADQVAAAVVQRIHAFDAGRSRPTGVLQRDTATDDDELQMKPLAGQIQREELPDDDELQMKALLQRDTDPEDDEERQMKPLLQRQAGGEATATDDIETAIQHSRGSGQPLAESIRMPMEQAFGGVDFSRVKVHTDTQSDQLNRSIQAKAFTTGQDVFFRQGMYEPGSREGQELLAHELSHVVQQNAQLVGSNWDKTDSGNADYGNDGKAAQGDSVIRRLDTSAIGGTYHQSTLQETATERDTRSKEIDILQRSPLLFATVQPAYHNVHIQAKLWTPNQLIKSTGVGYKLGKKTSKYNLLLELLKDYSLMDNTVDWSYKIRKLDSIEECINVWKANKKDSVKDKDKRIWNSLLHLEDAVENERRAVVKSMPSLF